MNVRVRFESSLRYLADAPVLEMELDDGTALSSLLQQLVEKLKAGAGAARTRELNDMTKYVAVLRNGEIVQQGSYANTVLAGGDVIYLVPPIAGGA